MRAYIYKYVNKINKKVYIGSRSAYKGLPEDDFNVKYFSSSKDKEFRTALANGELEGEILFEIDCENANTKIVEIEHKIIKAFWDKYGKEMSYNHYCNGEFSHSGCAMPEEAKKKIAEFQRNKIVSKETREKLSEANKGKHRTEETKNKLSEIKKGNKCALGHTLSESTKQKISESLKGKSPWNKGVPCKEETKRKLREINLGKKCKKFKWKTPEGEIVEMSAHCAAQFHPDWIKINTL